MPLSPPPNMTILLLIQASSSYPSPKEKEAELLFFYPLR
jgi:hypothetical protein